MTLLRKIIHLESVDSTNNYAAILISERNISHGTVILADEQTAGRGQRGAQWASNSGENLLMSLVLLPDNLSVSEQFVLSQITALSIVSFLRKIGIHAQIKWPNDILISKKKVAGVLIENQLRGDEISSSIIGIGLNLNQLEFDVQATSVRIEIGQRLMLRDALLSLMLSFEKEWESYCKQGKEVLEERYLQEMYGFQSEITLEDKNGLFTGQILGVKSNGILRVQVGKEERNYDLKEVRFILQNEI